MAKLTGGILGRVKGKASGLVFSSARTATGKANTVRALVIPANPNTAGQQAQRSLFSSALDRVKQLSPDFYQSDWNRAVNQLPGFQSLMSMILSNNDGAGAFTDPPDISLGDLHYPDTVAIVTGSGEGEIDFTWSDELGANGTDNDEAIAFAYAADTDTLVTAKSVIAQATRSAGAGGVQIAGLTGDVDYICGLYFRGAGTALGKLSKSSHEMVTAGAA